MEETIKIKDNVIPNDNQIEPDKRKELTPDNSTAIPNDLVDKYMPMFNKENQLPAVLDLIQQAYKAGLDIGRNESPLFAIIPMTILENKNLSANSKLLYGEIMALAKKTGKCYATNKHLATILGLKRTSIPNLLRELSGNGLVIIDTKRNKKGTYRDIIVSFFNNGGYSTLTMGGIAKEQGQKRYRQNRNRQEIGDIAISPKSPHQEIIDFYYDAYKEQEGVSYMVSGGDGKAVKEALTTKQMSPQEIKSLLRWYLERPDFKKFPTIKTALSGHFINLFRQSESDE